ncbi:MAG: YacL family protein [Alishewanella agri]|nr:YacL family protein [Alishewanella agri]
MEYDFIYDRDSRRYRLKLATEQAALQQFLLDEFAHHASAYQSLLSQLQALKPYQDWQYQGREFSLLVQQQEVRVCHNSLLATESGELAVQLLPEELDDDLQLDESGLVSECGLADLVLLLQAWQEFLPA